MTKYWLLPNLSWVATNHCAYVQKKSNGKEISIQERVLFHTEAAHLYQYPIRI